MANEMIERVARAIGNAYDGHCDPEETPANFAMAKDAAIAAIEAMKDPSLDMLGAMYEAMFDDKFDGSQAPMAGAGFDAAIDAALEGKEGE